MLNIKGQLTLPATHFLSVWNVDSRPNRHKHHFLLVFCIPSYLPAHRLLTCQFSFLALVTVSVATSMFILFDFFTMTMHFILLYKDVMVPKLQRHFTTCIYCCFQPQKHPNHSIFLT